MGANSKQPDVAVIGGGLIGCSIALRLTQAGLRVCVLDRGDPGMEASAAAAGMLAPQGETIEPDPFYRLCAGGRDLYAGFVREIEELSGEKVDYRRDGTLLVGTCEDEHRALQRIYRAQSSAALPIEILKPEEAIARVPGLSPEIQSALFVAGDHWVDNERLTRAAIKACQRVGVTFCAGRRVTRMNVRGGRIESVEASFASGEEVTSRFTAEHFVLAAGCWSAALVEPLGVKLPIEPCRGQMVEFDCPEALPLVVRAGHHYLVPRHGGRVVAGTTSEYVGFEKAVTGEGLRSILAGVARFAPFVNDLKFRRAWSGLRPDTADHLPILGRGEIPNLIFATGHFRNGILLAPVTAEIVADLIVEGSTHRTIEPYRPTRFRS
jgi:glycine oxidase